MNARETQRRSGWGVRLACSLLLSLGFTGAVGCSAVPEEPSTPINEASTVETEDLSTVEAEDIVFTDEQARALAEVAYVLPWAITMGDVLFWDLPDNQTGAFLAKGLAEETLDGLNAVDPSLGLSELRSSLSRIYAYPFASDEARRSQAEAFLDLRAELVRVYEALPESLKDPVENPVHPPRSLDDLPS